MGRNAAAPDGMMVADGPWRSVFRRGAERPVEGTEEFGLLWPPAAGWVRPVRHWNGPGLVEGDGSTATMQSYLMMVWAGQESRPESR